MLQVYWIVAPSVLALGVNIEIWTRELLVSELWLRSFDYSLSCLCREAHQSLHVEDIAEFTSDGDR